MVNSKKVRLWKSDGPVEMFTPTNGSKSAPIDIIPPAINNQLIIVIEIGRGVMVNNAENLIFYYTNVSD